MCGIVGYIRTQDVKDILLNELGKLEYRGYNSAGIAVVIESGSGWKSRFRFIS